MKSSQPRKPSQINRHKKRGSSGAQKVIVLILFSLLGYGLFSYFTRQTTDREQKHPETTTMWHRIKRRLFDQDLPAKTKRLRPTDMMDISSNPSSLGLGPSHRVEQDSEIYSQHDRESLDSIVKTQD